MAINKQTKISYQDVGAIDPEDKAPRHTTYNLRTFSNVDDAKNFYYTTNELNVFDKWCSRAEWAVVNDDDGNASQLKVTVEFNEEPANDAINWHAALDDLNAETVNFLSGRGNVELKIKESDDHLF